MSKECFLPIETMCVYLHTFVYLHLKHISIILNVNVLKRAVDLFIFRQNNSFLILFYSCTIEMFNRMIVKNCCDQVPEKRSIL
jgi:hypothetical protein